MVGLSEDSSSTTDLTGIMRMVVPVESYDTYAINCWSDCMKNKGS